jgi:hypothetical protein
MTLHAKIILPMGSSLSFGFLPARIGIGEKSGPAVQLMFDDRSSVL